MALIPTADTYAAAGVNVTGNVPRNSRTAAGINVSDYISVNMGAAAAVNVALDLSDDAGASVAINFAGNVAFDRQVAVGDIYVFHFADNLDLKVLGVLSGLFFSINKDLAVDDG